MSVVLRIAQHPEADRMLADNPLALLTGMLLDQQVTMEKAFTGPYELTQRLGHEPSAEELADFDTEALVAVFSQRPAIHRFPGAMAKRVQGLCRYLSENYRGDAEAVWRDAATGADLLARLKALPGFGDQKAKIFLALLGKQLDVRPEGWREAAGAYGEDGSLRSVADITGPESLTAVREFKRQAKQ
ncbi:MAG: HhH-GPD-type base excision DNA repair protein, partial [Micromonosporaceae bacterium]